MDAEAMVVPDDHATAEPVRSAIAIGVRYELVNV